MRKNKEIKIFWADAIIYENRVPSKLSQKITEGFLCEETNDYLVVKNPITSTYDGKLKKYITAIKPEHKFLFIPKGMIYKIE